MSEQSFPNSLDDVSGSMSPTEPQTQVKSYTQSPTTTHEVQNNVVTEPNYQILIISLVIVVVVVLIVKPLREFVIWFVTTILIPTLAWVFQISTLWFVWLFKNIVTSHMDFMKHLSTPRSVIFPSLDDQRHENDKSINRKLEE